MLLESIPLWLEALAYAYIISSISCSLIIVYDILGRGNHQMMPIMDYVWPITTLYLNVFGLWAYLDMGRPDSMNDKGMEKMLMGHMHHKKKPFWKSIFVSATHCGAGCEIGDFIGEWSVFLVFSAMLVAGSLLYTEYAVDFVFAYALGIIFQYVPIRQSRPGLSPGKALKDAVKADSLSLIAFEVGLFGWMAVFSLVLFGSHSINPTMPVYWFMMQIGMLFGHFTSYPANWFLVKRGIKMGM